MMTPSSKLLLGFLALALQTATLSRSARAQEQNAETLRPAAEPQVGTVQEFLLYQNRGDHVIDLHEGTLTTLFFPDVILDYIGMKDQVALLGISTFENKLFLSPKATNIDTNLQVITEQGGYISLRLRVVGSGQESVRQGTFREATREEIARAEVREQSTAAAAAVPAIGVQAQCAKDSTTDQKPTITRSYDHNRRKLLMQELALAEGRDIPARIRPRVHTHGPLTVTAAKLKQRPMHSLLFIKLKNGGDEPVTLTGLRVFDREDLIDHTEDVVTDAPDSETAETRIPARSHVHAAIIIRKAEALGSSLLLKVTEPETMPEQAWIVSFDDEEPAENEGRMSVHVQGMYGAIWLGQKVLTMGVPEEQLAPTSLKGLGVRLTYGLTKRLSFEAEAMGASSGEAEFEDVTVIDGQMTRTGTVYRSATLGRVLGGLMMRFGEDTFRPLVRLGLGLQGAGQSAEIVGADGVRKEGPEGPFEFTPLLNFGLGLDLQLGEHITAGIAASALTWSRLQTIELGLHLGYAWKP